MSRATKAGTMGSVVEVPRVRETEVVEKAKRRGFTAEYKQRILEQADRARAPGEVGALLRQEGLYSSHLSAWRRQREAGELAALTPKKRGPKAKVPDAREREVAELRKQLARAEARAARAEAIIDVQKKLSLLLGIQLPELPEEKS